VSPLRRGAARYRSRLLAAALIVCVLALTAVALRAQAQRRLTTIDAIRLYPGFYHLQNIVLRGEFVEDGQRIVLHADERNINVLLKDVQTKTGPVEVRGLLLDVGRLEPTDPRLAGYAERLDPEKWPKPGEELMVTVTAVVEAQPATTASVRALALEPWKFEGQTVTVTGNFRGRNLFGDLPDAPGKGRYDFTLRGAEGSVWVSGQRPRGRGFDLDVERRLDTGAWLQVTGMVSRTRGLVLIETTQSALAQAPAAEPAEEAAPPPPPLQPTEVVFSSPTEGEVDVLPATAVRIQFSRGLRAPTIAGHVTASYLGAAADAPPLEFRTTYDAPSRAITLRFAQPLEPFRTVRIQLVEGLLAFDGAPVVPWALSFTVAQ
jgi:hypothetical protein